MVVSPTNADSYAYRKVNSLTTGLFTLDFHKPKTINLGVVFELTGLVDIGDNFIAIKIIIILFVVLKHAAHLFIGGFISGIKS